MWWSSSMAAHTFITLALSGGHLHVVGALFLAKVPSGTLWISGFGRQVDHALFSKSSAVQTWMPLKALIEIFTKGLNWIVHRYEHTHTSDWDGTISILILPAASQHKAWLYQLLFIKSWSSSWWAACLLKTSNGLLLK